MGIENLLAVVEKSNRDPNSVIALSALSQVIHEIICSEKSSEYRINGCYAELKSLVDEIRALSRKRLLDQVYVQDLTQYKSLERVLLSRLRALTTTESQGE